jgi:O-antigen/teichoic acid export membrane protein
VLQLALSISLYYVIGINGVILGYAIPLLSLSYLFFSSFKNFSFSFGEIRTKMRFTMHAYSVAISQAATNYADKLIIVPIFGFTFLGFYQLGFQFLMLLSVIPGSLYQYLLPQEASGVKREVIKKIGLILSVVLAIVSYIMIPYAVQWFFPQYLEAIPSAQIMIFSIIPLTINSLINARLLGTEKSKGVFLGSAVYTTVMITLLYFLGMSFGLIGAAMSMVISLSCQSLVLWMVSKK